MVPDFGDVSPLLSTPPPQAGFLVCGLGSLGQHCILNLKRFGVAVNGINLERPTQWEIPHLPGLIDQLVIGDCRDAETLKRAGIAHCRAVLLVTENERVNLEAALTARVLNPQVRLVLRSDKQNLNDLLALQLQNVAAFEPTQLAAPAFALAAYGQSLLGFFSLDRYRFQVITHTITPDHSWCDRRSLATLESSHRRLLSYRPAGDTPAGEASPTRQFYTWSPDWTVQAGDTLVTLECDSPSRAPTLRSRPPALGTRWQSLWRRQNWQRLGQQVRQLWPTAAEQQIQRVALLCGATVVGLCGVGTLLLHATALEGHLSLLQAFYYTFILLLGGYGDIYGDLDQFRYPGLIQFFSAALTLAGTAFVGVLYALLTEKLLALRFELRERRPPLPEQDHVIVVWLGRVGQRVIKLLQTLNYPVVGISPHPLDPDLLPQVPLLVGDLPSALERANLHSASSIVAVSEDEIQNLEAGLIAQRVNPQCRAIIRTYDQQLTDRVAHIFPFAQVLCTSALSAEAFAGAAFGEQVISLFRLYHQTVLVTQYDIDPSDTLVGLMLAEVAYGYGVVPIWHCHQGQAGQAFPSEDGRLKAGDQLVVLATIGGLRRVEQGQRDRPDCWVRVDAALTPSSQFEGATAVSRVTGCGLAMAREFMANLPAQFPQPLYQGQALRLVRWLGQVQVQAHTVTPTPSPYP